MFSVKCPTCNELREVEAKKPWMKGVSPYSKLCPRCCQKKPKSAEHKQKLSESVAAANTPDIRKKKSEYAKAHPEIWNKNLVAGKGGGWNKNLSLPPRSEETKAKIGDGVRAAKKGGV